MTHHLRRKAVRAAEKLQHRQGVILSLAILVSVIVLEYAKHKFILEVLIIIRDFLLGLFKG